MNGTTSIEALADTIEAMPDAADTSASGGPTAPPGNIPAPQKPPACSSCKRVFKFGDYICVTTEPLCKRCYGANKDRPEARVTFFTSGEVSSVNRDRAWKRSKKLQRMAKKQQKV